MVNYLGKISLRDFRLIQIMSLVIPKQFLPLSMSLTPKKISIIIIIIIIKRPDLKTINKQTYRIVDFAVPAEGKVKNQRNWKERQILGPRHRTTKSVEHQGDGDASCNWCTWNGLQRHVKVGLKNWKEEDKCRRSKSLLKSGRILRKILVIRENLLSLWFQLKAFN